MQAIRRYHPLAGLRRVKLEQIADIPLIGYLESISPYFRKMLQSMFGYIDRKPHIVQESVVPTLLTLVEAGVGAVSG